MSAGWSWNKHDFLDRTSLNKSTGCWEWRQALVRGYGHWTFHGKTRKTHHVSLYLFMHVPLDVYGPKIHVDHLCKNKKCCNPFHLEVVTARENLKRARPHQIDPAYCQRGHEYTPENTRWNNKTRTKKYCRTCKKTVEKRYEAKRKLNGRQTKR